MFEVLFKNGNNVPTRDSFDKYYMPLVEIKDFNALIECETYVKPIEVSRNDDYATGNLLDFSFH